MKQCSKCRKIKQETEFYKDNRAKDGLKCQCKRCHNKTSVATRSKENARKINREYMRRRRIEHPNIVSSHDKERETKRPNTTVVMLIPARTDTTYFHDYIYGKAEIRFIRGRLKFGNSKNAAPFPSMLVVMKKGK